MDIREYLFRHKLKKKDFCKDLNMSYQNFHNYVNRRASPSLERAIGIYHYSGGEIAFEDMLALNENGEPKRPIKLARSHSRFAKKDPLQDCEDTI